MMTYRKFRSFWVVPLLLLLLLPLATIANEKEAISQEEECEAPIISGDDVVSPLHNRPEEFVDSSQENIRLAVRRWIPPSKNNNEDGNSDDDDNVKSVLVVHHGGAGWHSGYFDILGQYLKNQGIEVMAYDQVGSGHSDSMGPSRQYFDSMDTVVNDLTKMIADTKAKYNGNKKVFVLGESFGGAIVLHQILSSDPTAYADGYILSGPVITVRKEMLPPKPVIAIVNFLAMFFPLLTMPGTDFFSTFDDAFGDKRWAKAGRADPMIQEAAATPPRLGMISSVLSTMDNTSKNLSNVDAPFIVFIGDNDIRVNPSESEDLVRLAKSTDKKLVKVPGGYHQLYQDVPEVTQSVLEGIKEWILERS